MDLNNNGMDDKLKCVLVDDERNSRIVLKDLLSNFCKEAEVVGEAGNIDDAFEVINREKPHLVFLDIQMPMGNGFSLLKKFDDIPFEIIFITSFDKYAINAIKFSALDYLLKPIDINELKTAFEKALLLNERKGYRQNLIVNLLQSVDEDKSNKKIAFHKNGAVRLIKVNDISHIESDWNYCNIFTSSGEKFSSSKTLKEFEEYLIEFDFFIRIHKNCMVNANHISKYSKGEPCIITMNDGSEMEISRRKKQEVLEVLKR